MRLGEERLGVSVPEGLEQPQLFDELRRQVGGRDRHVDPHLLGQVFLGQRAVLVQQAPQLLPVLLGERETRGHRVAAELPQHAADLAERLVHGVSLDRAAGALHAVFTAREDDRRSVISLFQLPGNDPRETLMTLRKEHHEHTVAGRSVLAVLDLIDRVFHAVRRHGFPRLVQFAQVRRAGAGLRRVFLEQQLHRGGRGLEAAGGIDAGADHEAQRKRGQMRAVRAAHVHQA